MKVRELPQVRGQIVADFIGVETAISFIIAKHYLGATTKAIEADFLINFLGNEQCTFALKRNIFAHILRKSNLDGSYIDEINKLNKIRNTFAHRQHVSNDNPQTDDSEVYYINPRFPWDISKNLLAEDKKKEFYSILPDVQTWLFDLEIKMGVHLTWQSQNLPPPPVAPV